INLLFSHQFYSVAQRNSLSLVEDSPTEALKPDVTGGGLAEITLTFDSGRVMYGFCSLKEPTAALPRYILINWVGEDVPDARKCACASHVATIADFFQVRPTMLQGPSCFRSVYYYY
uniref:ADF-H domain-containing protein n=1 Tax=Lates calcarifer TaxID=8187 RepID=A0A4W6F7I7_LATCA